MLPEFCRKRWKSKVNGDFGEGINWFTGTTVTIWVGEQYTKCGSLNSLEFVTLLMGFLSPGFNSSMFWKAHCSVKPQRFKHCNMFMLFSWFCDRLPLKVMFQVFYYKTKPLQTQMLSFSFQNRMMGSLPHWGTRSVRRTPVLFTCLITLGLSVNVLHPFEEIRSVFAVLLTPFRAPELTQGPSRGMGTGVSLRTRFGMEKDPGRAELTASGLLVTMCLSSGTTHTTTPPSQPPGFAGCWHLQKQGQGHFLHRGKCVALRNSILSVSPAIPAAVTTFRESSTLGADLSSCECGCNFHRCPWKATNVYSNIKHATVEILGGYAAHSSKFCGCNNRGEESHCIFYLLFFPSV